MHALMSPLCGVGTCFSLLDPVTAVDTLFVNGCLRFYKYFSAFFIKAIPHNPFAASWRKITARAALRKLEINQLFLRFRNFRVRRFSRQYTRSELCGIAYIVSTIVKQGH